MLSTDSTSRVTCREYGDQVERKVNAVVGTLSGTTSLSKLTMENLGQDRYQMGGASPAGLPIRCFRLGICPLHPRTASARAWAALTLMQDM
jgi:hypothetical protein